MHVEDLPLEILIKIFQMLKIEDLKSIVLVSRYFRIVGEDPSLWKSIEIPDVHPDDLEALLNLPRLSKLQSLHISDWLIQCHFRQLEHKTYLKCLNISRCFLHEIDLLNDRSVDPSLCSKVMNSMEVLNINRANLSISQYAKLFEDMAKSTKIKTLIVHSQMLRR